MDNVGLRIKTRRLELGLTQTELAKRMGYNGKSAISKVEVNDEDMSMARIKKFAAALECTPAYLMGWEDSDDIDIIVTSDIQKKEELFKRYSSLDPVARQIVDKILGIETQN